MKGKHFDKYLFLAIIVIAIFGIVMIYSASSIWAVYKYNDAFKFVKSQSIFFLLGVIAMLFLSKIDYHLYEKYANKILLICLILLILVLIPGI